MNLKTINVIFGLQRIIVWLMFVHLFEYIEIIKLHKESYENVKNMQISIKLENYVSFSEIAIHFEFLTKIFNSYVWYALYVALRLQQNHFIKWLTHIHIIFREPFAKIINAFKINHNAVYLDLLLFVRKQPHQKCVLAMLPASNDYDNVFDLHNQTIQ